ncbi:hypothetical protein GCM10022381_25270 [Leifsonia kafniensis]|uniref:Uncharacterized protein n=1 Tax=Leifsonia kafniensis TaxID=475957 RepID=A0ABP7KLM6_9MICO
MGRSVDPNFERGFAAPHDLYGLSYFGNPEFNRIGSLEIAKADGTLADARDLVQTCKSECDVHGCTRADIVNADDIRHFRGSAH